MEMLCTGIIDFSLPNPMREGQTQKQRANPNFFPPILWSRREDRACYGLDVFLCNLPWTCTKEMAVALSLGCYLPLGVEQSILGCPWGHSSRKRREVPSWSHSKWRAVKLLFNDFQVRCDGYTPSTTRIFIYGLKALISPFVHSGI